MAEFPCPHCGRIVKLEPVQPPKRAARIPAGRGSAGGSADGATGLDGEGFTELDGDLADAFLKLSDEDRERLEERRRREKGERAKALPGLRDLLLD